MVYSADKLHAEAPLAAGYAALASFPAVLLALVATRSFGAKGVYLPPATDARWQLWCTAIVVAGAVVALAVISPLMIFWQVGSRPAWLAVMAAQFSWPFAGVMLGAAVSGRRKS